MAEEVGALVARVVADVEGFRADMNKAAAIAQSQTGKINKALASIKKSSDSMSSALSGARSVLGLFGVSLSARAFASWIKGSLDAKNMTLEQLAATEKARAALVQFSAASDSLGQAIGQRLAPVISAWARSMSDLGAIISGDEKANVERKLNALNDTIAAHQAYLKQTGQETDYLLEKYRAERAELEKLKAQYDAIDNSRADMSKFSALRMLDPNKNIKEQLGIRRTPNAALEDLTSAPGPKPLDRVGKGSLVMLPEVDQKALEVNESIKESEQELTDFIAKQAQARQQASINAWNAMRDAAGAAAQQEIAVRQTVADSAIGLLQAVGAEHRGAAIALIAFEKAMAVKEILINAAKAKAMIVANYEVAIAQALAIPFAGAAIAAGLRAKEAAALAAVGTSTGLSIGLVAAEGLVQAAQLSHGGTRATLGTSANPFATSGGSADSAAIAMSGARGQKVIELHVHGNVYGAGGVRKLAEALRDEIDEAGVILIGPDSLQAQLLGGP